MILCRRAVGSEPPSNLSLGFFFFLVLPSHTEILHSRVCHSMLFFFAFLIFSKNFSSFLFFPSPFFSSCFLLLASLSLLASYFLLLLSFFLFPSSYFLLLSLRSLQPFFLLLFFNVSPAFLHPLHPLLAPFPASQLFSIVPNGTAHFLLISVNTTSFPFPASPPPSSRHLSNPNRIFLRST